MQTILFFPGGWLFPEMKINGHSSPWKMFLPEACMGGSRFHLGASSLSSMNGERAGKAGAVLPNRQHSRHGNYVLQEVLVLSSPGPVLILPLAWAMSARLGRCGRWSRDALRRPQGYQQLDRHSSAQFLKFYLFIFLCVVNVRISKPIK